MPILSLLIKYWQPILAAIVTALLALGAHKLDVYRINELHKSALKAQAEALIEQCEKDKKLTTEVSRDYQNNIANLNRKLADAKRMRASAETCVSITGTTGGRDAAKEDTGLRGTHGVAAESLFDFSGDAEQVGLQLDACQAFIKKTWAARGR